MRYSVEELKLVYPTKEYEEQVMRYREIFLKENQSFDGCAGLEDVESFDEWIDFDNRLSNKYGENYVPSSVFLGVRQEDNKVVGIIDIRHSLSDFLYDFGGHIGYSVLPEERRKGYAKEMLRQALLEGKNIGINRALLTCDKDNIGSYKTIIANGGVLENEVEDVVGLSESGTIQRYWITLKKRYASRFEKEKGRGIKTDEKNITVNEKNFKGDVYSYNFKEVKNKITTPNGMTIIDNNYKLLEFYDYNSKVKLTTFINEKGETIEWYFDIAREIGKENGLPYEDDLYLDVVVTPKGEIILLDEDELKEALDRKELTKEEYENAYKEAENLMDVLKDKKKELKEFTDKYFKLMIGDDINGI